jgi:hypothetical protein
MNDQYVVRSLSVAMRTALPALVILAGFAAYSRLRGDSGLFSVVAVLLVVATGVRVNQTWTLLRVDRTGVAMTVPGASRYAGSVLREAPWTSVWRMELNPTRSAVAVVLRPDAPMPGWPTSPATPGDPRSGARYEQVVPGLDSHTCATVVRNVAPGTTVRIVS